MRVSAKVDYALRAAIELAVAAPAQVKGERIATAQAIPQKFLENILADLRNGGLVASQRGADGGYRLARAPAEITVADVIRVVEGPIAAKIPHVLCREAFGVGQFPTRVVPTNTPPPP